MGRRFAGGRLVEVMAPWKLSSLENAGNWVGKTEDEWLQHTQAIKKDIINRMSGRSGKSYDRELQYIIEDLMEQEQYSREGAADAVRSLMRGSYKSQQAGQSPIQRVISEIDIGTPHTNADEQIALAVLNESGIPAQFNNRAGIHNTDFILPVQGGSLGIDAQQTFARNGNLSLGVSQKLTGIRDAWQTQGSRKLQSIINELRKKAQDNPRGGRFDGSEMKLLETADPRFNPASLATGEFKEIGEEGVGKQKDYLIIANRAGQANARMKELTKSLDRPSGKTKGPYDPTAPKDIDLVSLGNLRQALLDMTPEQLEAKGITLPRYTSNAKSNMTINVPASVYKDITDTSARSLNPDVVEYLLRR